jgi:hypothetical protein
MYGLIIKGSLVQNSETYDTIRLIKFVNTVAYSTNGAV